ncbi:hypothetical protein [Actinomadura oligospora]|uniref:hypothetical protein n=1 Tax=Actinomadura oligospora TaxID=111804 RepID=UPI0012FB8E43|nr:hypothetical protein [Actinomadura oligospora]
MALSEDNSGQAFAELVDDQLGEERKLKESLAQRGLAVVTSSGVLVALSLGATSLASRAPNSRLPGLAVAFVIAALACFIAAAFTALAVNAPRRHGVVDVQWLREAWERRDRNAHVSAYEARLDLLTSLRAGNRIAGRLLLGALLGELAAVILLTVAAALILIRSGDWN